MTAGEMRRIGWFPDAVDVPTEVPSDEVFRVVRCGGPHDGHTMGYAILAEPPEDAAEGIVRVQFVAGPYGEG